MITETDHMFMRPPKNVATEEKPVGFGFYYMISTDPKLLPVVKKFLKPEIDVHTVDAVGPSPRASSRRAHARGAVAEPRVDLRTPTPPDKQAPP